MGNRMVRLEEIKRILKEMHGVGYINQKAASEQQKVVATNVSDISFDLFVQIKVENPNYAVDKSPILKKYKVDGDEEQEPSIAVMSYFNDNPNALHEMIGYFFFGKKKTYITENHLFYMKLFSMYKDDFCDIFLVSKNGKFWIVDEKKTDMKLVDFISRYIVDLAPELRGRIEQLFDNKKSEHDFIQSELNDIAKNLSDYAQSKNFDLQSGAITFMDFLGWKGLWQNRGNTNHLENVSNLINGIKEVVRLYTCELFPHSEEIQLSKLISISDTIAIFTPQIPNCAQVDLLKLHAKIAKYILEECVKKTYPIRGAITLGKYNTKNNIMIGPGIDECASWHETCNWIGVHFTPSAELHLKLIQQNGNNDGMQNIVNYNVPVKNGYPKVGYCVNWKVDNNDFTNLMNKVQSLMPEIAGKYMNTYDFLNRKGAEGNGKDDVYKK